MLSSLLQNNLRGGDMFFEMEKWKSYPRLLCFEQHTTPRGIFCTNPQDKYFIFSLSGKQNRDDRSPYGRSVTSTFYDFAEIAVSCYTRLVLKVETIDSPLKKCVLFLNLIHSCLYYILSYLLYMYKIFSNRFLC